MVRDLRAQLAGRVRLVEAARMPAVWIAAAGALPPRYYLAGLPAEGGIVFASHIDALWLPIEASARAGLEALQGVLLLGLVMGPELPRQAPDNIALLRPWEEVRALDVIDGERA